MFKYTKAAVDIVIEDIKKYCNIFKYGSMLFTFVYFAYSLYSGNGNLYVNVVLVSLYSIYALMEVLTATKDFKMFKKIVKRFYKALKLTVKAFTLGVMIYSIYSATTNINGVSIILATLMIIMWVVQLLLELVISIFEDKKDLIVAGWNKDIENLKKPVTTVNNFIRKVKGEEIVREDNFDSKEIRVLEKKLKKTKDKVNV